MQQKDSNLELMAAKIKLLAQVRIGELSKEIPKAQGKRADTELPILENRKLKQDVLSEAGVSINEASLNERLSDIPEEKLEEIVATQISNGNTPTRKATLKKAPGAQ